MKLSHKPAAIKVALCLYLVSLGVGILLIAAEYMIGEEFPANSGVITTVISAMTVGIWFGYKSGQLMSRKTRWYALLLWSAISIAQMIILLIVDGISLYEFVDELGWFSLLIVATAIPMLVIAYFIFKSGEKMGIKSVLKNQAKQG